MREQTSAKVIGTVPIDNYLMNVTCTDVDECEEGGANDCQQLCDNTEGSYVCSCTDGFTLADSSNCTGTGCIMCIK